MTPTEEQAAAAKFEQAGRTRERLATVIDVENKFTDIKRFMDSNFQGDIYCRKSCVEVPISFLLPSLKNEKFKNVEEFEVIRNTMRLSKDAPKGVAEIYSTFFAFNLKLKRILYEEENSVESNFSGFKLHLKKAKIECRLDSDSFKKFNDLVDVIEPWIEKQEYLQFESFEDLIEQTIWLYFSRDQNFVVNKGNNFSLLTLEDFRTSIQKVAFDLSRMSDQTAKKCGERAKKYERSLDSID